ncbi:hypothetical protein HYH03_011007 [Edaphochlamys debaryana]|uniref:BACK domain-containing protein n=1 Tax=Edaphochlamys debaryana TaxID=47281 RepID=A0A836BVM4_9CHLO|nr:hypothetical protein HYH03_011007 [Edaphochlamys debaryana]|eukprot:KAG2490615.1 hypothetical protein HYH03_011007 [Edaphochlamys debaryana]
MSAAVRAYQRSLFGNTESSDCVVRFYLPPKPAKKSKKKRVKAEEVELDFIGDPLPGHLLILRPGSSFFKSQAERWSGVAKPPSDAELELRVPLEDPGDLRHALSTIGFTYTGELDVEGATDLLSVRRIASFLGVEGCLEAVDAALVARAQSGLHGVVELYACRQLLPGRDDDPAAAALLPALQAACREGLAKSLRVPMATLPLPSGGSVKAGEVLAWAFPDAPSVLSDPATKRQLLALPAAALEALLSSESFGTDMEDTVLLLLAEWLSAHHGVAQNMTGVVERLCRCVRLSQLSSVYLHGVLPLVDWFPISPPELRFIQQYR